MFSDYVPQCHLDQVCLQYRTAIDYVLNTDPSDIPRKMSSQLSVVNFPPTVQSGSDLLHNLVNQEVPQSTCAIDFIDHEGKRADLTYKDLQSISSKLAGHLHHKVCSRDPFPNCLSVVALLLPQCPELYISILSILKIGAAFCPLALDAPRERIKFITRDISAKIIISLSSLVHLLPEFDDSTTHVVLIDKWDQKSGRDNGDFHPSKFDENNAAYIYYTSGSTGIPKGVAVSHRSVTQSLLAHNDRIPQFSRFLQFAAPIFDVFIFELFFPLYRGATIVARDRQELLIDLPGVINSMNVDAAELTPTVASTLLRKKEKVPGLKILLTIGEMLTTSIISEFGSSATRGGILIAMYGPTECAIHCTCQADFPSTARTGIIGTPLPSVSAFVTSVNNVGSNNSDLKILPVGHVGELVLGGYQLASGYVNRPEETKKSFVTTESYGTVYMTGDKARLLPDGTLEVLGRISAGQVKLRGQRVELGEIENTILANSSCASATAMVIDQLLVVFCVAGSEAISVQDVEGACKRWLPSYMVPSKIVLLEKLPHLASGKIDRGALKKYHLDNHTSSPVATAAFSKNLQLLCDEASKVLRKSVRSSVPLSDYGIDSLGAIKYAASLRRHGYTVGVSDILEASTIEDLEGLLAETSNHQNDHHFYTSSVVSTVDRNDQLISQLERSSEVESIHPCTPVQSGMLTQAFLTTSLYCNWVLLQFPHGKEVEEVAQYVDALAKSNEILRSGFVFSEPPAQIVWKSLADNQVREVDHLEKDYWLDASELFLRPFNVQLKLEDSGCQALVQIPHFVYDGWSMDLMLKDLSDLCNDIVPIERPQYNLVNIFYSRYSESQSAHMSRDFWRNQLEGMNLRTFPNYNGQIIDENGQCTYSEYYKTEFFSSQRGGRKQRHSLQAYFQTTFTYLLSSYLGQSDLVYGLVQSGRTLPIADIDKVIGPCINIVPMRVNLSTVRTTDDLVQNVQDLNHEIMKHSLLPLRDIKRVTGVRDDVSLFESLFIWQESPVKNGEKEDFEPVQLIDSKDYLEFKFVLEVEPRNGGFHLNVRYHSSVFPCSQVEIFLEQLKELMGCFCASRDRLLSDLSHSLSFANLSISQRSYRDEPFIHPAVAIKRIAELNADYPAIQFYEGSGSDSLLKTTKTYRELHNESNRIARLVRQRASVQIKLVAIILPKSIDAYIAILGVLKASFGYLFITPQTPSVRKENILEEAGVTLCISRSSLCKDFNAPDKFECINIDTIAPTPSCEDLDIEYDKSNMTYATFTSGSTGKPKGVLLTAKNLQSNIQVLSDQYPSSKSDRLLQFCSLAFDVSIFDILYTWCNGMCLCAADNDILLKSLESAVNEMDITHLSLTPTVASLVDTRQIPQVKFLVTAGEAMSTGVIKDWQDIGLYQGRCSTDCYFASQLIDFQGYGPSETTNICTVKPRVTLKDLPNNVGWPLRNTSVLVLDEKLNMVPRGGFGEMCFGGDQVAFGYVNRPGLTSEKFIDHPVGGRLYRSGDLGRLLPNGCLLFHGRLDDQIKIRGQRVEVGELNTCILKFPFARECVSSLVQPQGQTGRDDQILVSFWVPRERDVRIVKEGSSHGQAFKPQIQAMFEEIVRSLPSYMVPAHIVSIEKIPHTVQGKADKSILASIFHSLSLEDLEHTAFKVGVEDDGEGWTDFELVIAGKLNKLFNIPFSRIGRHTSFFSLGLDSISALPLSRTLSVPLSLVLKHASVAALARVVESSLPRENDDVAIAFTALTNDLLAQVQGSLGSDTRNIKKVLPCTPLQQAMLSASEVSDGSRYMNRMIFRVDGDSQRLKKSWQFMVERHDILRTIFVPIEDQKISFAQVVLKSFKSDWIELPYVKLSKKLISDQLFANIISKVSKHTQPSYCFVEAFVGQTYYLAFLCHHALYDGAAMNILLKEVEIHYSNSLLPPTVPYEPFLQHVMQSQKDSALQFWANYLRDFKPSDFPLRVDEDCKPDGATYGTLKRTTSLPLSAIEGYCKSLSTSLLSLGQAIWAKLLSVYSGCEDVCFGNVISGRNVEIECVERLVAPCFNTIPVRVNFAKLHKNIDLVRCLQNNHTESMPYQLTALREIWKKKEAGRGSRQLFDTLFLLQFAFDRLDPEIWVLEEDVGNMDVRHYCVTLQEISIANN